MTAEHKATRLADSTEDWQLCDPPQEERRRTDIHDVDEATGQTRHYVRDGRRSEIGLAAIEWSDDATREWLETLVQGGQKGTH